MADKTFRELTVDTAPARTRIVPTQAPSGSAEPTKSTIAEFLAMTQVADLSNASADAKSLLGLANYPTMLNALTTRAPDTPAASTLDLGAIAGLFVLVTGTGGSIGSFGAGGGGSTVKILKFVGVQTLVHNGSSMILCNGNDNILTEAGDTAIVVSESAGFWTMINYQRFSGVSLKPTSSAEIYNIYVSKEAGANDSPNNGLSTSTPKLTIAGAIAAATTGQTIGLRRGDTWNEAVDLGSKNLSFGAYGAGVAKPIIKRTTTLTSFTNLSGNIWYATLAPLTPINTFIGPTRPTAQSCLVNGTTYAWFWVASTANVNAPYKYFHDTAASRIYVYNVGTPTSVEVPIDLNLLTMSNRSGVTISNIEFRLGRVSGITNDTSGLVVDSCNFKWLGGSGVAANSSLTGSYDMTVRNCNISFTSATGIVGNGNDQPGAAGNINLLFENNTITSSCLDRQWPDYDYNYYYTAGIKSLCPFNNTGTLTIKGNFISSAGDVGAVDPTGAGGSAYGIWVDTYTGTFTVEDNVVWECCNAGIGLEAMNGLSAGARIVQRNQVVNCGKHDNSFESSCILVYRGVHGATIRNNSCYQSGGGLGLRQVLCIQGFDGTGEDTRLSAAQLQTCTGIACTDNIFWADANPCIVWERPGGAQSNTFTNNLFKLNAAGSHCFAYSGQTTWGVQSERYWLASGYTTSTTVAAWNTARGGTTVINSQTGNPNFTSTTSSPPDLTPTVGSAAIGNGSAGGGADIGAVQV